MDIFNVLSLIGGLSLFLFGMSIMGQALEKRAGNSLRTILTKMTTNRFAGFFTGCGVTAVIQSSSATTVMVVGLVNSGLLTLRQAINVIMGANVGTTVTSWILSLSGISSSNMWIKLLKPSSFTPVLALIGIAMLMLSKKNTRKDTGTILLGFAVLMFGMEAMSGSVKGLSEVAGFQQLFIAFQNPILGLLAGAILTAIIQSSSASVGILQALSMTGQVTIGAAVPIIMGQNIGTCVTALISSVGANKNAKRAALVHLAFNIIGSVVWLSLFSVWKYAFAPAILQSQASSFQIAIIHSLFNIACVIILMPNAGLLEKLSLKLISDGKKEQKEEELDTRLFVTPTLALEQCHSVAVKMAQAATRSMKNVMTCIYSYSDKLAEAVREDEDICDHYEDIIGTYLVNLSSYAMEDNESEEAVALLKMIGDYERVSDHAVNILESVEELRSKDLSFSDSAKHELKNICNALSSVLDLSYDAFITNNEEIAFKVEPLEQVIDKLKEELRTRHILRMQKGDCSIEAGFVWSDLLTNFERTSDHCSNIAGCIIDMKHHRLQLHESQKETKEDNDKFKELYDSYLNQYALID